MQRPAKRLSAHTIQRPLAWALRARSLNPCSEKSSDAPVTVIERPVKFGPS
jgi:hypothetical protein